MLQRTQETERPHEWLRALRESRSGYADLLRESGDLVVAAYRLASARCRASALATAVPTLREVRAAVTALYANDSSGAETQQMSITRLREECEKAHLLVIGPGHPMFI